MSFGELVLNYPSIKGIPSKRENAIVFEEFKEKFGNIQFEGYEFSKDGKTYHIHCYAVKDASEIPFFNAPKPERDNIYIIRYSQDRVPEGEKTLFKKTRIILSIVMWDIFSRNQK